ncbi:alkylation response protein AidB-like acyl-CoA dehydrogenase [Chromobacterium alkanivorans]|uniref:acyl-CoA dehydrogenase family protein n=1 Tax=Chromobacterium TaxID=535 RepID=UPI000652DE77|nr:MULTISPECIES: acyl-CoA dehydrogenase family protein [Chromobacterium]KMN81172.1 acyl-CoA dehydrogenase [Chromobacterium sp. LK11]MBN3004218.1 acyl-CoA dehydrogenase family protein [Chromobacterium alkanivorans]MCS3805849.1 alkylation response protein AidB-like acyl-CoA dehydrogenase [Chromobacterium alkanivorans]MCS3820187.1 alkylation response protein AidB-like acyl-CoA dehydrogenase [Chromobacterium alkanivorans]MCS3874945.1 alkylation response protein AidB-like acyl-CoA dehydrogenase [Ch
MDFALTEEQIAFQDSARDFAASELAPRAAEWDEEETFPLEVIRRSGEMGFLGLYTPEAYGGLGLPRLDSAIIFEELAAGCTSTAAYLTIHNMVSWMIASFGSPELAERWVPRMVSGELLGSYCLTEPGAGSDAASLKTRAERKGDHYVLNGSKMFISGAGSTQVLVVMARTGGPGPKGVSAFVVPADAAGVQYGKKEKKMGWNSQPTRAITFDNVEIPAANRLGEEGQGFAFAMKGLDGGRINIATCAVGTAQAALAAAQRYVQERQQFGQPLAELQSVQFRLADMLTELVAARQMVRLAAWKLDQASPDASAYCAMAKRLATDLSFNVANNALQLFGGYGYLKDFPLERHVRDLRVHQILEGTNEVMRMIVARKLLQDGALETLR